MPAETQVAMRQPRRGSDRLPEDFTTAHIQAKRLGREDLEDLVRLHLDHDVSRFIGGVRSPSETAAYLDAQLRHWADHGFGLWVLRSADGRFLGRAGLRYIELEGQQELEIAYTIAKFAWGRGLGTEIASFLVDLWFAHLSEALLVGVVEKGNGASERILLKTGFSHDRDACFHGARVGVFHRSRTLV